MTYIPPLTGALASAGQVQRTSAADKEAQASRAEVLRRSSAASRDRAEHEVESGDAVILQNEEEAHRREQQRKKRRHTPTTPNDSEEDNAPLDLTA